MHTNQISIQEFIEQLMTNSPPFILDVREAQEYDAFNIEGYHIPLGELSARLNEIPRDKPIVVHCRSGHRSQTAVDFLEKAGFQARNLVGGILAWQSIVTL